MKKDPLKTKHVYLDKTEQIVYLKKNDEKWYSINFHWIPVVQLNHELHIKTNNM